LDCSPSPTSPRKGEARTLEVRNTFVLKNEFEMKIVAGETPEESNICSPGCNEMEPGVEREKRKQGASANED